MKLQHLIIIFLIVMLPLALIMSQYTNLQIDTLSTKTKYDTALLGATSDTMSAFELNTINSESSSVIGEEIRDLEAIISTFTTSLSTSFGLSGASDDYILGYVPAMVFGLYDGYYIYAKNDTGKERELKPYVYYTKTYKRNSNDITISYSLDNYVTIYGTYNGEPISAAGYLVVPDDVEVSSNFAFVSTTDEDGKATRSVIDPGIKSDGVHKSWLRYKGYDICQETIYQNKTYSDSEEVLINNATDTTEGMMYYYEALQFTKKYNEVIRSLSIADQQTLLISRDNDPEDENSAFMNEKINVIKNSITKNLNNALYNYEGGVAQTYEMPQLTGEDWEKILNNISIIAFLKDIPIGTTTYNNYVVVNSTTNVNYNSAKSIDFIEYVNNPLTSQIDSSGYYHKITCENLIDDIESGSVNSLIGYGSVDFERLRYAIDNSNSYYYYYKHNEYADYDCEIEPIQNQNVATMESYIISKTPNKVTARNTILKSYYTAVGRVRYRLVKASSYINLDDVTRDFTVRYFPNGGSWSKGNPAVVRSSNGIVRVISEIPVLAGKTLVGWAGRPNATIPEVKVGDTIYGTSGKTIDLYAVYSNQYKIIYDLNGGEGGPAPREQTKVSGRDYTIAITKPTKSDSIFLGWSTDPYATTPEYLPGDVYDKDADLTLYAIWTDETVMIKYNTMGGSYIANQEKGINATIKLEGTPVLMGSDFQGWSTVPNGTIQYKPGDTYSGNVDLNLYAVWRTKTYRITYNANGGELPASLSESTNCTKIYGISYAIPDATPTREGYEFIGWSRDPKALVPDPNYARGKWYTENADLTLYAVWEGDYYTIVYNANGGNVTPDPQQATKDKDLTITDVEPSMTGYIFVGWSSDPGALESEVEYKARAIYKERTSITLYAVWKKQTYIIAYDANGGSPNPVSQTKYYGESINITLTRPSRENYYFAGWSKSKNGTVDYNTNQVFRENASITLYAVWSAGYYDIIYNANGGSGAPQDEHEALIGGNTTISDLKPEREGYTFAGWSTNKDAKTADSRYAPGSRYAGPDSIELFAVWEANPQEIIINPNGGKWKNSSGTTTLSSYKTNETFIIENPIPPEGYSFSYWSVTDGDADIQYISTNNQYQVTVGIEKSTITANYTLNWQTLIYDKNTTSVVSNMPEAQYYQKGDKVTISDLKPEREGYTFAGWSTNRLLATPQYQAGDSFTMPANNITLYAVWKKIEFVSKDFDYTGNVQEWTVPVTGEYKLEVWGAQGSDVDDTEYYHACAYGGNGGYSYGNVFLTQGTTLYVVVGAIGYNGSGDDGGGGATHIASVTGEYYNIDSGSLDSVLYIMAGGGAKATNITSACYHDDLGYGRCAYRIDGRGGNATESLDTDRKGLIATEGNGAGYYPGKAEWKLWQSKCGYNLWHDGWYNYYQGGSGYLSDKLLMGTTGMQTGIRSGNGFAKITYQN